MSWTKYQLAINILLLCSFSRTILPVNCADRLIRAQYYRFCMGGMFTCKDSTCIQETKLCDGFKDCPDGSDEYDGCARNRTCMSYEFRCDNGDCKYNNLRCDGVNHCQNGSDEANCDMKRCEYNGQLCDQICTDITNTTYQCSCHPQYVLQEDKVTCKVSNDTSESLLVYSNGHSLRGLKLPSMNDIELVSNIHDILAVTVDALYVYWSAAIHEKHAIYRSLRGKNQPHAVVRTGPAFIEEIAIDWVTSNIYFVDSADQKIGVCTNNGSYCTLIIHKNLTNPTGLALDPFNGIMYWSDWGRRNGYIGKATMDGKNEEILANRNIGLPQAITIDVPNARLYWVDHGTKILESIRLDGTNRQRIMHIGSMKPHSIAIFEDKLYWSDYDRNTIESCHKFTGKQCEVLKQRIDGLHGMHIYHELLKPNISNPCNSSGCSELCLLGGKDIYTCACTLDKKLREDGHTCEFNNEKQYLMVASNSIYFYYHGEFIGRPSIKQNKLFQHFNAMAYDPLNSTIFVNDVYSSTISRFDTKTEKIEKLDGVKNQQIGGMSFDHIGNNLYWSNIRRKTIEIYSMETKQRTTVPFPATPKNILVIPEFATMVVVFCINSTMCQVDKLPMDAPQEVMNLVPKELSGQRISLAYDNETKRIFWADQATGIIESITLNGTDRQLVYKSPFGPESIAVFEDFICWSVHNETKIFKSYKTGKIYRPAYKIVPPLVNKTEMIHLILTNYRVNRSEHKCSKNNGGCSHVCLVSSSNSYKCACPNGFVLDSNNHTCKQIDCTPNEYKCSDNSCISNKKLCDGTEDCPDFDDELKCPPRLNDCPTNDFQCFNGNCISRNFMCDGKNDCEDWSDEMNCAHRICADETNFKCVSSGWCIPESWQCDGQRDCDDGSDESGNCEKHVCPPEMNRCSNGICIDHTLHCDGVNDCGDNSDETECAHHEPVQLPSDEPCTFDEYKCFGTDKCIPKSSRCNHQNDCPNNDDEHYCSTCLSDQFTCNNLNCISKDKVCDKYHDCEDMSDEEFCDQNGIVRDETNLPSRIYFNDSMSSKTEFVCNNGETLDHMRVCDDKIDCNDQSDEGGNCTIVCPIDLCQHRCERTPQGPVCVCMEGYKLKEDGTTCEDIDECNLGICSQVCHNDDGSFRCDCLPGFSLRNDRRSCKIIDSTMEIISATTHDIRRITHNLLEIDVIHEIVNNITGMDINADKNLLYWSNEQLGTITEFNLTNKMERVISNLGRPNVLAVDWITSNVYFFNNEKPYSIMACSQLNNRCVTITELLVSGAVMSMAVDPIHGSIYWAQTNFKSNDPMSTIYRCKMDGDDMEVIAQGKIGIVSGIAIDYDRLELFWTDTSQGLIMKSKLDGTDRTVFRRVYQPLSINIYDGSVYWMMGSTRDLYSCSIHDKLQCHPLGIERSNIKDFLIISHISRQPYVSNVCEKNNCGWMCVIKDNNATCVCQDGYGLNRNGTCWDNITNSTVVSGNDTEVATGKETSGDSDSYVLPIVGLILSICILGTVAYCNRKMIFDCCRTMVNRSTSHHSASYVHQRDKDDDSLPIIASDAHEFANPLSSQNPTTPASPKADTEMVELHFSKSHTVNTSHSDTSDHEAE